MPVATWRKYPLMLTFGRRLPASDRWCALEAAAGETLKPAPKAENKAALQAALRKPQFWMIALAFPLMALNHGILLNHIMPMLAERNVPSAMAINAVTRPIRAYSTR